MLKYFHRRNKRYSWDISIFRGFKKPRLKTFETETLKNSVSRYYSSGNKTREGYDRGSEFWTGHSGRDEKFRFPQTLERLRRRELWERLSAGSITSMRRAHLSNVSLMLDCVWQFCLIFYVYKTWKIKNQKQNFSASPLLVRIRW